MRNKIFPYVLLTALACAPATTTVQPAPTPAAASPPRDLHWSRTSAEYRAIFLQTYRAATVRVQELARGRTPGTWGVILDGDETVLDNSEYQRRLFERGARFDINTWNAWVREVAADSLPGAGAFVRTVRDLGGRVVMVTGREEVVCEATRANLRRLGMQFDAVLCQQPNERGKNDRFRAAADGTSSAGLPRMDVVMFVGDNIQDFPDGTQELRAGTSALLDNFGRSWFVLPNPMYGSWERNAVR
jgi:5'-nucleotidase (lipoprotein e(P4) family)